MIPLRRTLPPMIGLALWMVAEAALGASVSLQPVKDNTLFEDVNGNLSSGAGDYFFVGRRSRSTARRRGLLEFDVASAIPAGATIDSAALTLNVSNTNGSTVTIALHRALSEWGEGASDAGDPGGDGDVATSGDATWLHTFHNTSLWSSSGGDFQATASGSQVVDNLGLFTWTSTALMVNDVQAWLNSPASNHGWLLKAADETPEGTAKRFDSRENPLAANRPTLTINFTPVPEPTSLCLLAISCVGLARCRRAVTFRG